MNQQPDRSSYFGSSDIAAVLGISPWRTKLDVFLDKTKGREPVTPEKQRIFDRGHRLEPYILDMYAEDTGEILSKRNHRYTDHEFPFMAAEIDAETESGKNVEAKSTHQFAAKSWGLEMTDEVPVYYNAQAQFGMGINGASLAEFPVLIGIDDFRIYRVKRDEEIITNIRKAANDFWQAHIVTGVAPDPQTVGDLERLFPWDSGTVCQATDQIRDMVLKLKGMKSKLKTMEADAEEVAKQIKLFMGEHAVLQYGATRLCTWAANEVTRFDAKAFRAKHAKIAPKFENTTVQRTMRIK